MTGAGGWRPPPKRRRPNTAPMAKFKMHTKTVLCLPPPSGNDGSQVAIPRGETRSQLTLAGLVGKICLDACWKAAQVESEITSLFRDCFQISENESLPYHYISTTTGTKKLSIPKTSSSFIWDATQVLSLCSRDSLYIMAKIAPRKSPWKSLSFDQDYETGDESDDEYLQRSVFEVMSRTDSPKVSQPATASTIDETHSAPDPFRSYISLVEEGPITISDDESQENELSTSDERHPLPAILHEIEDRTTQDTVTLLNVRRSKIWEDTCRHIVRKKFQPASRISVKFADGKGGNEGAVDAGGPRREFLRMLIKAANNDSGIFIGPEKCRSLFPNGSARQNDLYRLVGVIIAWSVAHGGPAGNFLSPTMFEAVAYGDGTKEPRVQDISNPELRDKVSRIANSTTLDELSSILADDEIQSILEAQGACTIPKSVEDKVMLARVISRHVLVDSTRFLLEEFKNGLTTLNVLESIQKYPEQFRDMHTSGKIEPLDASTVDVLFTVRYAEQGSNARTAQELAVIYWRDYLQDCDNGDAQAKLEDVLVFATGADVPPVLDFDSEPTIEFTDGSLPTANTCSTILRLPIVHQDFEEFKEKMDFAILNSPVFGRA